MQNFSCSNPLTHNISESINYQVNPSLTFPSRRFCVPAQSPGDQSTSGSWLASLPGCCPFSRAARCCGAHGTAPCLGKLSPQAPLVNMNDGVPGLSQV